MNEEFRQVTEQVKDPFAFSWLTYGWVVLISAWGGLVRFLNSFKERKESLRDSLITLVTGLTTSVFVGVITFYVCEAAHFEKLHTAICVAITGHLGSEAIRFFRVFVLARLRAAWMAAFSPVKVDEKDSDAN